MAALLLQPSFFAHAVKAGALASRRQLVPPGGCRALRQALRRARAREHRWRTAKAPPSEVGSRGRPPSASARVVLPPPASRWRPPSSVFLSPSSKPSCRASSRAARASPGQPSPVVVFDLDGTLMDNRPRTLAILQELAHRAEERGALGRRGLRRRARGAPRVPARRHAAQARPRAPRARRARRVVLEDALLLGRLPEARHRDRGLRRVREGLLRGRRVPRLLHGARSPAHGPRLVPEPARSRASRSASSAPSSSASPTRRSPTSSSSAPRARSSVASVASSPRSTTSPATATRSSR